MEETKNNIQLTFRQINGKFGIIINGPFGPYGYDVIVDKDDIKQFNEWCYRISIPKLKHFDEKYRFSPEMGNRYIYEYLNTVCGGAKNKGGIRKGLCIDVSSDSGACNGFCTKDYILKELGLENMVENKGSSYRINHQTRGEKEREIIKRHHSSCPYDDYWIDIFAKCASKGIKTPYPLSLSALRFLYHDETETHYTVDIMILSLKKLMAERGTQKEPTDSYPMEEIDQVLPWPVDILTKTVYSPKEAQDYEEIEEERETVQFPGYDPIEIAKIHRTKYTVEYPFTFSKKFIKFRKEIEIEYEPSAEVYTAAKKIKEIQENVAILQDYLTPAEPPLNPFVRFIGLLGWGTPKK